MQLKDLVGPHNFRGVFAPVFHSEFGREEAFGFILDGREYLIVASRPDGYRSSVDEIIIGDHSVKHAMMPNIPVLCIMDDDGDKDILHFYDQRNGKCILSVGTDTTYSYYPTFVYSWMPENLKENEDE